MAIESIPTNGAKCLLNKFSIVNAIVPVYLNECSQNINPSFYTMPVCLSSNLGPLATGPRNNIHCESIYMYSLYFKKY